MDQQSYYALQRSPSSSGNSSDTLVSNVPYSTHPYTRREVEIRPKPGNASPTQVTEHLKFGQDGDEEGPATCDFVRKLYNLLEDQSMFPIMCWGPRGDFFVIKDVGAFSTDILPHVFRHSNFASFVRQLNKYDFHKVKTPDDGNYGENSWIFRHNDFHRGDVEALESIRRKVPGSRKNGRSSEWDDPAISNTVQNLQAQISAMARQQDELSAHIVNMQTEYVSVLDNMLNLQRDFAQQDGTIQQLMQYAMQMQNGGTSM